MSYTTSQLLKMAANYEQLAVNTLVTTAKKKEKKKSDPKSKMHNKDKDKPSKTNKDSKKKEKKSSLDAALHAFGQEVLAKYGQAKGARQAFVNGAWVSGDDIELTDGQKVREWDGTRWKQYSYRASDDSFVDWSGYQGAPTGGGTYNPTQQNEGDANRFMQGGQPARGGGGQGGAASMNQWGGQFGMDLTRKLQEFLISQKINVPGGADGKLGPLTKQALGVWQKQVGLPVTKELDQATFTKLSEFIPEFKQMLNASKGITKAPISVDKATALVDQHENDLQDFLKAYQSGEMMQNKQTYLASMANTYKNVGQLYQQVQGLMQNPQIDPDQKKEFEPLSFRLNGMMVALAQYWQLLNSPQQPAQQPPAQQPPVQQPGR